MAKVYGAQPGPFLRDLIEATMEGGLHAQLFQQRLAKGIARYEGRAVLLGGADAGGWSAPQKPMQSVATCKGARRGTKNHE
jgi:hypothetical protein